MLSLPEMLYSQHVRNLDQRPPASSVRKSGLPVDLGQFTEPPFKPIYLVLTKPLFPSHLFQGIWLQTEKLCFFLKQK